MKKIIVFALFLAAAGAAFSQDFTFMTAGKYGKIRPWPETGLDFLRNPGDI
jgi:hypothetical protein